MLEAIREKAQGWIAKVILALIIVPFALWGVDSYIQGGGGEPAVAEVGDEEIGQREFFRTLQNQRDALANQGQREVDVNDGEFRTRVLDQLVDLRLVAQAAADNGMVIPASQMQSVIQTAGIFQVDGKFSEERFQAWLRDQGLGEKELTALIQREALAQQFQMGYGQGAVVAAASADRVSSLLAQQREIAEARFAAETFRNGIVIDDKAVVAEYEAKKAEFATPALVRIQYLALSAEAIRAGVQVGEPAAREYYQANLTRYQEPEQRRASHILVKVDAGADKAAARTKAEQILAQVRAAPGKFADLARQHSDDPGSAASGGDLGMFRRESMVKPFADATFGMKVGEISELVESEFGFHIIRLDGIVPATQMAFELVRDDIVAELSQQQAERKFAEVAERFSNVVYEQPDSLAPAAKEFSLAVQETGWIGREQASPAFLAKPALMDALFSPEALQKHQNTEAVEVAPGVLVSARVLEHKPAGVRPLAEVTEAIRARLLLTAAKAKSVEAGQAALKAAEAGQPVSGLSAPRLVSRMQPADLPGEAVKAIFKANVARLPAFVGVETRDGYRLYRIGQVVEGAVDDNRRKLVQRDLTRMVAQEELRAYLAFRKDKAGIEINEAILEKKAE